MTDVKRLLSEATPLPWHSWRSRYVNGSADAVLAVYAVNHLPDYLAAVEALELFINAMESAAPPDDEADYTIVGAYDAARAALARLRDEVMA